MVWLALAGVVIIGVAFAFTISGLANARFKVGRAETQAAALMRGREARSDADEVMAEPAADESAWISGVRQRVDSDE